ncbi:Trigger factor [Candidatus Magnetomoraceae bacterium gMMP-15]
MQVNVEDLTKVKKIFHVEFSEEEVTGELDTAYNDLRKTTKVKGFRKGKVPRSILERMFKKTVHESIISKLVNESFQEALKDTELTMLGEPQVNTPELKKNQAYKYDITVETKPEIGNIDFQGLTLNKSLYSIDDKEIDIQLKALQKNMSKAVPIDEDRGAQEGDMALIDYEAFKDDKPFDKIPKAEGIPFTIGEGKLFKQFDEQIQGIKPGESKNISITFPKGYPNQELAGLEIVFKLDLKEIRKVVLPEIDDALAKSLGEYEDLDALKKAIRKNLEEGYSARSEQEIAEQIFRALIDKTDFDMPDIMVQYELNSMLQETEQSLAVQEQNLEHIGHTKESFFEKYKETAKKQVRRQLILNQIIDQEKITIDNEEIEAAYKEINESTKQPLEEIKAFYEKNNNNLEFLKNTIQQKKALRKIKDVSIINEVKAEKEI